MIFLIPARAGSKRLPGKNKRLFCGLPLWMWSWATAKRIMGPHDQCLVSSDDKEIYEPSGGMPRAAKWCTDEATMHPMIDMLLGVGPVCLLQPTSPTRSDSLVRMMIARGDSCRSVTDGVPNGQCWVFRDGMQQVDVETNKGHDIDTLEQFNAAEQDMLRKFQ